jgi:hypothetical protein
MGKSAKRKGSPHTQGRKSWVTGSKLVFLSSHSDQWQQAVDSNHAGEFYTRVTKLWLNKYPHTLPLNEDLAFNVEDPADETLDDGFNNDSNITEEQAEELSKKFKNICQVGPLLFPEFAVTYSGDINTRKYPNGIGTTIRKS